MAGGQRGWPKGVGAKLSKQKEAQSSQEFLAYFEDEPNRIGSATSFRDSIFQMRASLLTSAVIRRLTQDDGCKHDKCITSSIIRCMARTSSVSAAR